MKRFQFDELLRMGYRRPATGGFYGAALDVPCIIMEGRLKGSKGIITGTHKSNVEVVLPDGQTTSLMYTKVEWLDADGNPDIKLVSDMTGREIKVGNWVSYSQSAGHSSHALEIGRVEKTTPTGGLVVKPYLRNGNKIKLSSWRTTITKTINDPDRCLLIPVEVPTMTMWILKDFEDLDGEE